jgi:hypothetical protein
LLSVACQLLIVKYLCNFWLVLVRIFTLQQDQRIGSITGLKTRQRIRCCAPAVQSLGSLGKSHLRRNGTRPSRLIAPTAQRNPPWQDICTCGAISSTMKDYCAFGATEPALAEKLHLRCTKSHHAGLLRLRHNGTRPGGKIAPAVQ